MIRWEGGGTFVGQPERATKGAGIARDGAVEITRAREIHRADPSSESATEREGSSGGGGQQQ